MRKNWKKAELRQMIEMYMGGATQYSIAKHFGVTQNAARIRLERMGLTKKVGHSLKLLHGDKANIAAFKIAAKNNWGVLHETEPRKVPDLSKKLADAEAQNRALMLSYYVLVAFVLVILVLMCGAKW